MVFTWNLILLVAVGAIPLALSYWVPRLLLVGIVYNGLLAAVVMMDYLLTLKPELLSVQRRCDTALSMGAANPIEVWVRNPGKQKLEVMVKDEPPPTFQVDAKQLGLRVDAFSQGAGTYRVTPLAKGDYRFGDLNVRYRSRWGLLIRQGRFPAEVKVKVYPNLQEVRKYELLARRGRLLEAGIHTSRTRGVGTEFESLRDYLPDDEFRQINWKATARRAKLISSQYQVDRSQNVILMLDARRMMSGKIGEMAKLDYAVNASLMVAYVATLMDDRVGLVAFSHSVLSYLPARKGRNQLYLILEHLYNLEPELVEPDYAAAFRYLTAKNRKRSLVLVFTDLIDESASQALLAQIASLPPSHLAVCVTISDSEVVEMAESFPATPEDSYRKAMALQVLEARRTALASLRGQGVFVLDVPADKLSVAAINRYLELKGRSLL